MKTTYQKKHEIYNAIDIIRDSKPIVDPVLFERMMNYLENNAEVIAGMYEDED